MLKALFSVLVVMTMSVIYGCGQDANLVAQDPPAEEGAGQGDGGDGVTPDDGEAVKISYQKMQQYLNIYCNQCHAGSSFMTSENGLKASSAKARIANGSMPTPGAKQLPSNVKTEMLGFFK